MVLKGKDDHLFQQSIAHQELLGGTGNVSI